jgi:hypothetical protein
MGSDLKSGADANDLSPFAVLVLQVIEHFTVLPKALLMTQCAQLELDPVRLQPEHLRGLQPLLVQAIERFASRERAQAFERGLSRLIPDAAPQVQPRTSSGIFRPDRALSGLAEQVVQIIENHTALAWTLLESHCERAGFVPDALGLAELEHLRPGLAEGVARFTSPEKGEDVSIRLQALIASRR